MLAKEDCMVIQALTKHGVYQRDIAETLGVHPKTVQRALTRRGASPPRPPRRPSLLDGYRAEVDRRTRSRFRRITRSMHLTRTYLASQKRLRC